MGPVCHPALCTGLWTTVWGAARSRGREAVGYPQLWMLVTSPSRRVMRRPTSGNTDNLMIDSVRGEAARHTGTVARLRDALSVSLKGSHREETHRSRAGRPRWYRGLASATAGQGRARPVDRGDVGGQLRHDFDTGGEHGGRAWTTQRGSRSPALTSPVRAWRTAAWSRGPSPRRWPRRESSRAPRRTPDLSPACELHGGSRSWPSSARSSPTTTAPARPTTRSSVRTTRSSTVTA